MKSIDDLLPIRVSTLRGDLKIPFDTYLKIADKFILYCRQGDSFEGSRLQRLKAKKLKKMFIPKDSESGYRDYLNQNIEMAYNKQSDKPIEVRSQVIHGVQQAAAEDVIEDIESEALYEVAKEGSRRYVDFILKEDDALQSILSIENTDQSLSHHGVTVASISIGIAGKMGLGEEDSMSLLTLGALLHDLEHYHSSTPFAQSYEDFSKEEWAEYQKHPLLGAERARKMEHFDESVLKIIAQHEEYIDGSGFPAGLTVADIDPLAQIVGTANSFDRYISFEGLNPKDALKKILIEKVGLHPLDQLRNLQEVLKSIDLLQQ